MGEHHTTHHSAQTALTLADGAMEKLLKRTSRQLLLSVGVSGSYGPCANLFLEPTSPPPTSLSPPLQTGGKGLEKFMYELHR